MRPRHAFLLCGLAACAWLAGVASSVRAEAMPPAWQTTWIAPPQPVWDERFVLPPGMPSQLRDVTLRQTLRTSLGGDRVRLAISNAYGRSPLRVGRMTIRRPGHAEAVPVHSRTDIFVKDLGLVLDLAADEHVPPPVTAAAHQLYLLAQRHGLGARDDSSIVALLVPPTTPAQLAGRESASSSEVAQP